MGPRLALNLPAVDSGRRGPGGGPFQARQRGMLLGARAAEGVAQISSHFSQKATQTP